MKKKKFSGSAPMKTKSKVVGSSKSTGRPAPSAAISSGKPAGPTVGSGVSGTTSSAASGSAMKKGGIVKKKK